MRNIIHHINKPVVVYGAIGTVIIIVAGIIGWPYLYSHYGVYGMVAAIVFIGLVVVFSLIAAYGFAGHTHLSLRRGHIDLRVYEMQQQTPLPLSSLSSTKISEETHIPRVGIPIPQFPSGGKRLHHRTKRGISHPMRNPIPQLVGRGEASSQASPPQFGKMGNPIPQQSGENIPLNALTEKSVRIFEFYSQHPDATLKQAENALGIPNSTIDRIKKQLIERGAFAK